MSGACSLEAAGLVAALAAATGARGRAELALRLGYEARHLERLCRPGGLSGRSRYELFRRVWSAWPEGAEKPRALIAWERHHPDARRDEGCARGRIRRCMACGEAFRSEGPHHRLCRIHRAARAVDSHEITVQGAL